MQNTPIFEENGPDKFKGIDIMRAVRSFDPCLPCGVHMYLGNGKVLETRHSPMFGVGSDVKLRALRRTRFEGSGVVCGTADGFSSRSIRVTRRHVTDRQRISGAGSTTRRLDHAARPDAGRPANDGVQGTGAAVMELHGAGLERMLEIVFEKPAAPATAIIDQLGRDDLVEQPAPALRPASRRS